MHIGVWRGEAAPPFKSPAARAEIGCPFVHQAAPPLEEITARVGRLGGVLYRMGECGLDHFAGVFVRSAAQSRKLDRNPCGTAAMPSSLVNLVLSKNPIDAVRRADSTLDARRVATFVTAESLC